MNVTRRQLLATTIVAAPFLSLAACAGQSPTQAIQQAAQDAQVIAQGLKGTLAQLSTLQIPGLTSAIVAKVGAAIADVQTVASSLATAATSAAAQSEVQQLEADLNAIVAALAGLQLPPQIAVPLQAAAVLLPVIETSVGLIVSQINAPKTSAAMTPAQARMVLLGAAAH